MADIHGAEDGEPRSRDPLGSCGRSQMRKQCSLDQVVEIEEREWIEELFKR